MILRQAAHPAFRLARRGVSSFVSDVLGAVTWRALLLTQCLGLLFGIAPWLERLHQPGQPPLLLGLLGQSVTALLVMLTALACDEAVRRGASIWRAFVVGMLSVSLVNVLAQWLLHAVAGDADASRAELARMVNDFLSVGAVWGTALMVYLNRCSARRLLSRLRSNELERAQAEQRLMASRLAAAEAQIDPGAVLGRLAEVRDLYAAGVPQAEERLEALIAGMRESVARGAMHSGEYPR